MTPFLKEFRKIAEGNGVPYAEALRSAGLKQKGNNLGNIISGSVRLTKPEYNLIVKKYPTLKKVQAPELRDARGERASAARKARAKTHVLRRSVQEHPTTVARMARSTAESRADTRVNSFVQAFVEVRKDKETLDTFLSLLYGARDNGISTEQLAALLSIT